MHFNLSTIRIASFNHPVENLTFPSITICHPDSADAGQLIRAAYDNFDIGCKFEESTLTISFVVGQAVACNINYVVE